MKYAALSLGVLLACLGLAPAPAAAADGENSLSVYLGYGTYQLGELQPHGSVLELAYERGFSDALSWHVIGGGGLYRGGGALAYSGQLSAGFTYVLDVLRYVPYVTAGVGGVVTGGGDQGTTLSPLIALGAGLDILHSRRFSYGIELRVESLLARTSFFTAGVRATWRWGYF
jgi:hypothetical protein